jgi:DNA-binding transcriptional LysR family regulator
MVNLAGIDLNLLVAFDALVAERSVSQAAQRVGLSQPAMSNALSRLRRLLDDPVMLRSRNGMEPTPRALELAPTVHQALAQLGRALAPDASFEPAHSDYRFRIACSDELELSLLPRLIERVARLAPGVEITLARATRDTEAELREGGADLYLGHWPSIPAALQRHLIHHEGFACIARRDHPRIKTRLTLRAYGELGHVVLTPSAAPGRVVAAALTDQGAGRRVALRTSSVGAVPLIVARSELIATLPRSLAKLFCELLPLQLHRPPIDTLSFPIHMVWHPRTHEQAPHRWLRQVAMDAFPDSAADW